MNNEYKDIFFIFHSTFEYVQLIKKLFIPLFSKEKKVKSHQKTKSYLFVVRALYTKNSKNPKLFQQQNKTKKSQKRKKETETRNRNRICYLITL
jgi:hypothetical protein